MRRHWRMLLVLTCACKAEVGGMSTADPDANVTGDAARDATEPLGAWGAPMLVMNASSAASEDDGTLSNSKLELVFAKSDPAIDNGRKHLYWMSRTTATSTTWSTPVQLGINVDGTSDETPRFSPDDLTLYFASGRAGTAGGLDIWQTTRPAAGMSTGWSTPTRVAAINSVETDKWCLPCSASRYLMISSRAPSTTEDIYEGAVGAAPTLVTQLSVDDAGETGPFVTADCKTVYFASTRSGANRIYTATRATAAGVWSAPQPLPDFAGVGMAQEDPYVSADSRVFLFAVLTAAGNKDLYISTR